jgi:hypothetical protein
MSFYEGRVIDTEGQKYIFANKDIGKIIYFDSSYYSQIDGDLSEKAYRSGIQPRELVINTSFLNLDPSVDLMSLRQDENSLESIACIYPTVHSLIQAKIDQLKDTITKLSDGQYLVEGKWVNTLQANARLLPTIGQDDQKVSFSTKNGIKYVNVYVDVADTGLSVMTSDGGKTIPFEQLPDDLSVFSDPVRRLISEKSRASNLASESIQNTPQASDHDESSTETAPQTSSNVGSTQTSITAFESSIIGNFTPERIQQLQIPDTFPRNYIVAPSFTDELPPTVTVGGENSADTVQFINRKICDQNHIIYYDGKLKTFVFGQIWFDANKRLLIDQGSACFFNPSDFNPDKVIKTTEARQTYWGDTSVITVNVYSTDNKKSVSWLLGHSGSTNHSSMSIGVNDDEDAQSVCNAFVHLIFLYGGKSEEF